MHITPVADQVGNPAPVRLPEYVQRFVAALQPEKVILFGSYAYGQPTPNSDVDLLIVMNTPTSGIERYLTVCRLLRPRPFPVDILVKTPEELADALTKGDFFLQEITAHGKVLYERQAVKIAGSVRKFARKWMGLNH
jgi:predicted nucleotidyltransferase